MGKLLVTGIMVFLPITGRPTDYAITALTPLTSTLKPRESSNSYSTASEGGNLSHGRAPGLFCRTKSPSSSCSRKYSKRRLKA